MYQIAPGAVETQVGYLHTSIVIFCTVTGATFKEVIVAFGILSQIYYFAFFQLINTVQDNFFSMVVCAFVMSLKSGSANIFATFGNIICDLAKHYMEIRGLGIIDVERIFGIRAIRYQERLEILVEMEVWDEKANYTRTGLEEMSMTISEIEIPHITLPILPGKNITVISEVIALNYLLKHYGYNAADLFQKRLSERISDKNLRTQRTTDYFEHDFE